MHAAKKAKAMGVALLGYLDPDFNLPRHPAESRLFCDPSVSTALASAAKLDFVWLRRMRSTVLRVDSWGPRRRCAE